LATGSELIGRDDELARLRGFVDPPPEGSRVLVLLGDAGMGKSVLLADAARQARTAGLQVLQVTGRESEQDLAFAGLHQLLRPVLDRVTELPERQAKALLGAFALPPGFERDVPTRPSGAAALRPPPGR
jgi:AAA ATPase domain